MSHASLASINQSINQSEFFNPLTPTVAIRVQL